MNQPPTPLHTAGFSEEELSKMGPNLQLLARYCYKCSDLIGSRALMLLSHWLSRPHALIPLVLSASCSDPIGSCDLML